MLRITQLTGFAADGADPYFIDSSSYSTTASSSLQTISWTHTTTADTTCVVVFGTAIANAGASISTVTYDGVALTQIRNQPASGNSSAMWRYFKPPIGSFTLSVTMSGTNDRFLGAHAVNLGNANAVNNENGTNSSTLETLSTSLTTTKNTIVVVGSYVQTGSSSISSISYTSPTTTTAQRSATNSSNNFGKRSTLATSTLQLPGTFDATSVSSLDVSSHHIIAAAFSVD